MDRNDGPVSINMAPNGEKTSRHGRNIELAERDAEPLVPHNRPPMANPEKESDDDVDDLHPFAPSARPGIDDGFFLNENEKPPLSPPESPDVDGMPNGIGPRLGEDDSKGPDQTDADRPVNQFPFAPEFGPNVVNINGVPTVVPDVNVYQHKKTLAQGMMDLALLSANANQLRYVLESYNRHPYYYASLIFISVSLIFQIGVGVGLILNSRYNVKDKKEICKANKINDFTVIGIFIVTLVNVFISAFGVADPPRDTT